MQKPWVSPLQQQSAHRACFAFRLNRFKKELDCSYNSLKLLDVSGQEGRILDHLRCNNNALTSINSMGSLTRLTTLFCFNNKLTGPRSPLRSSHLQTLECANNNLTGLDVSNHTSLQSVFCSNNQLQSIKVNGASSLTTLNCSSNKLASLDASNLRVLRDLNCSSNKLTLVDPYQPTEPLQSELLIERPHIRSTSQVWTAYVI